MAIELENVASGYSTGIINDNFQRIEDYVNENLLNRDGIDSGEANQMELPLDMNSHHIYNLPEATLLNEAVPLWQVIAIAGAGGSGGDANYAIVDTSTGRDLLPVSLDKRIVYLGSVEAIPSLDSSKLREGQQISVLGCPTGKDPDAIYTYSSGSTEEADGIEVIAPSSGEGRWIRRPQSSVRSITNLIPQPENGGAYDGGGFPLTAEEELRERLSGRNPNLSTPNIPGSRYGECWFQLPWEGARGQEHAPFVPIGNYRTIPLSGIGATDYISGAGYRLFEPVRIGEGGILSYRFMGEQPLFTVLRGNIVLARGVHGIATSEGRLSTTLTLRVLSGNPLMNQSQGDGAVNLATSMASFDSTAQPVFERAEFRDWMGPTSPELEAILAGEEELVTGYERGYIATQNSTAEELEQFDPVGSDVPVGPEVRTTEWFPVEPGAVYRFLPSGGRSTRRRIQLRYTDGSIRYFTTQSGDRSSYGLFMTPSRPLSGTNSQVVSGMRVYYSGSGEGVAETLSVKRVPDESIPTSQDVLSFAFTRKLFSFNTPVVFYPGAEYSLGFNERGFGSNSVASHLYRIESGGVGFTFDTMPYDKLKVENFASPGTC